MANPVGDLYMSSKPVNFPCTRRVEELNVTKNSKNQQNIQLTLNPLHSNLKRRAQLRQTTHYTCINTSTNRTTFRLSWCGGMVGICSTSSRRTISMDTLQSEDGEVLFKDVFCMRQRSLSHISPQSGRLSEKKNARKSSFLLQAKRIARENKSISILRMEIQKKFSYLYLAIVKQTLLGDARRCTASQE